jgi:hypothetical protein
VATSSLLQWTKLPSEWINNHGLTRFRWSPADGSDYLAALMGFTVIVNHADIDTGIARLTYDQITDMASFSRPKLSAGLTILERLGLIERDPEGRSTYRVANHDPKSGWCMFPARDLYKAGAIEMFAGFHLRKRAELDALKLLFLIAARRSRDTNVAQISYDKIEDYTGIPREHIKRGLSLLTVNGLIHTDRITSSLSTEGFSHAYRLVHINPRQHMGTKLRGMDGVELDDAAGSLE